MPRKLKLNGIKREQVNTPPKDQLTVFYDETGILCLMDSLRQITEFKSGITEVLHDNSLLGKGITGDLLKMNTFSLSATLLTADWADNNGTYKQGISIPGLDSTCDIFIFITSVPHLFHPTIIIQTDALKFVNSDIPTDDITLIIFAVKNDSSHTGLIFYTRSYL